ncbi:unnamed protein product [Pleuronectes platessa]|uniref:Uncharacterized protein n=1 Tax=Pleuronectes platessa TaxID=8262 RepID=A0A9N7U953_PLEPL|nr:unnamed protein product [Pleuronectes platessa]
MLFKVKLSPRIIRQRSHCDVSPLNQFPSTSAVCFSHSPGCCWKAPPKRQSVRAIDISLHISPDMLGVNAVDGEDTGEMSWTLTKVEMSFCAPCASANVTAKTKSKPLS